MQRRRGFARSNTAKVQANVLKAEAVAEDAKVKVYTISGKAGIIVYFGGI